MDQHNFGEIFQREPRGSTRPSRSSTRFRKSYNESLIAPNIGDRDCGDANASTFPCADFMVNAGIQEDFLFLINKVGLTSYMNDESNQYAMLTKIFVESFKFSFGSYSSSVSFNIYNDSISITLEQFCHILGIPMNGTTKKIANCPSELLEVYREITGDDCRNAQRGKIRNIQYPAVRYFTYYLATSILGRENTSNISHYHLVFLDAALNGSIKYNLGAIIARRLATKGPIYGGIIASRIVHALGLSIHPSDVVLEPQRLDLAAMKVHQFVTMDSSARSLVYRMLFTDGEEREIPLPQQDLFSMCRRPLLCSKEMVDEHLKLSEFYGKHDRQLQENVPAPHYDYTVYHPGASSSSYPDDAATSSYHPGGGASWDHWE